MFHWTQLNTSTRNDLKDLTYAQRPTNNWSCFKPNQTICKPILFCKGEEGKYLMADNIKRHSDKSQKSEKSQKSKQSQKSQK